MKISVNNVNLYYEKSGTGRPIILVHGNGEDHTIFDRLSVKLAEKYTVYALDSRCHGQSDNTPELGYTLMAKDTAEFIRKLRLEKPILLGFSDGGIIGLLVALEHPGLLSALIACGVNTHPRQLKKSIAFAIWCNYIFTQNPKMSMMLKEPDISAKQLAMLDLPVLITAGTKDIFPVCCMKEIADAIPGSELALLYGESHDSYVKNEERLLEVIMPFLLK